MEGDERISEEPETFEVSCDWCEAKFESFDEDTMFCCRFCYLAAKADAKL